MREIKLQSKRSALQTDRVITGLTRMLAAFAALGIGALVVYHGVLPALGMR